LAAAAFVVLGGAPPGPSPGQQAPPRLSQDYMAWVLASVVDLETDGRCGGARRVFLAGEDEGSRAEYWDVACREGGLAFRLQFRNEPERPVFVTRCEAVARLTRSRCFRPIGGRR
jgi:hypothetical protein